MLVHFKVITLYSQAIFSCHDFLRTHYKSPQALDLMQKQIKFVTIVVPVTYTLAFPVLIFLHLGAGFCGADANRAFGELLGLYYHSIPKLWQAWFKFVGIAA